MRCFMFGIEIKFLELGVSKSTEQSHYNFINCINYSHYSPILITSSHDGKNVEVLKLWL